MVKRQTHQNNPKCDYKTIKRIKTKAKSPSSSTVTVSETIPTKHLKWKCPPEMGLNNQNPPQIRNCRDQQWSKTNKMENGGYKNRRLMKRKHLWNRSRPPEIFFRGIKRSHTRMESQHPTVPEWIYATLFSGLAGIITGLELKYRKFTVLGCIMKGYSPDMTNIPLMEHIGLNDSKSIYRERTPEQEVTEYWGVRTWKFIILWLGGRKTKLGIFNVELLDNSVALSK